MMTYLESVAKAVDSLMKNNKRCIYLGEDVRSGQRGISDGFIKKYGAERVVDTPISESAFSGYALGLAIANYRPIVEFNFAGLVYVCLDQLFNQASKFKAMSGNKKDIPIIYVLPTGTKGGLAGHHSDNPYSTLSHLGIQSFMPLHSGEVETIFKYAYKKKEPIAIFLPVEEFRNKHKFNLDKNKTPGLKKLINSKKNFSKISIICTGTTLSKCVNVMELMKSKLNSSVSLYGLSDLSIAKSTAISISKVKSKKFLIVDDSPANFGLSSEVELILRRSGRFGKEDIQVISRESNFIPFNKDLEDSVRPTEIKIKKKLSTML